MFGSRTIFKICTKIAKASKEVVDFLFSLLALPATAAVSCWSRTPWSVVSANSTPAPRSWTPPTSRPTWRRTLLKPIVFSPYTGGELDKEAWPMHEQSLARAWEVTARKVQHHPQPVSRRRVSPMSVPDNS
jgi:hypothetical protein